MFSPQFTKSKLDDVADLNELVVEVSRIDTHAGQVQSDYKAAKAELDERTTANLMVEVPPATPKGKPRTIPLNEYRAELVSRAQVFCLANPEAAAADGKKSRNYAAGTVAWEKERDRVEVKDPGKLANAAKRLGKKIADLLSAVIPWKSQEKATALAVLKSIKLANDGPQVEFDKSAVQKGIKAKQWTPAVLGMLGMELVEGGDVLKIKTNPTKPD